MLVVKCTRWGRLVSLELDDGVGACKREMVFGSATHAFVWCLCVNLLLLLIVMDRL